MFKKLKSAFLTTSALFALLIPLAVPVAVHAEVTTADLQGGLSCGANLQLQSGPCATQDPGAEDKVNGIIKFAINIFSIIVGIVAVVFIIIGGLRYITSGGESSNIQTAKNTILFAVVGLVIVALAQIIVRFVLSKVASNTGG